MAGKTGDRKLRFCRLKRDLKDVRGNVIVKAGTPLDESKYKLVFNEASKRLTVTEKVDRGPSPKRMRPPGWRPLRPKFGIAPLEDIEDSEPPLSSPPARPRTRKA